MLKTKFRVADCIIGENGDYCVRKCAITEDGKKHIIQENSEGEKYFHIDNPYGDNTFRGRSFCRKAGDAIKAVLDDYADCILSGSHTNVFTSFTKPIIMIDRELGEKYHEMSKEGFKNAKFGYTIVYGSKNSLGGYRAVDADGFYARENGPKIYETKNEAREKFEEWFNTAHRLAKDYVVYYNAQDDEHFKLVQQELNRYCFTIVGAIAFDMIDDSNEYEDLKLVDNIRTLPNIGWDFEQELIPEKEEKNNVTRYLVYNN